MKVIVDRNVLISGLFFSGPSYQSLDAWRHRAVQLVVSPAILEEYLEVSERLSEQFPEVDPRPLMDLILAMSTLINAPELSSQVCTDPDDDKFLACAVASNPQLVISGDKALLKTSGYRGITVLKPRLFVETQR